MTEPIRLVQKAGLMLHRPDVGGRQPRSGFILRPPEVLPGLHLAFMIHQPLFAVPTY